jgi:hypothetical protein
MLLMVLKNGALISKIWLTKKGLNHYTPYDDKLRDYLDDVMSNGVTVLGGEVNVLDNETLVDGHTTFKINSKTFGVLVSELGFRGWEVEYDDDVGE